MFKNSSFERKSVKGAQLLEILEIFISHKFLKIKTSLIFLYFANNVVCKKQNDYYYCCTSVTKTDIVVVVDKLKKPKICSYDKNGRKIILKYFYAVAAPRSHALFIQDFERFCMKPEPD